MAAAKHQGPCVCGRSIGQHTRRAARRHRAMYDDLQMWAFGLAAIATVFRIFKNPGELQQLTDGFTEGIRALSEAPKP